MDEEVIRQHADALGAALVAGDIDLATTDFSPELRKHLGEVLGLLPLPASEATVHSIHRGGAGFDVVLRLVGETEEVLVQTRWKDREGKPTVVEAKHLSRSERAAETGEPAPGGEDEETPA